MMAQTKVNWQGWDAAAFARSRDEDKPLLLGISAVWCHWCHVMDKTTYSNDVVAAYINENYVPVRVDNDERPDINERYNQGGWPTTAFLTAEGEILAGATYVPPDEMLRMLQQIDHYYHTNRESISQRVQEMIYQQEQHLRGHDENTAGGAIGPQIIADILQDAEGRFDSRYGGWASPNNPTKFPHPSTLDLMLAHAYSTDEPFWTEVANKTLDGMANFGMYDHVEGGFFRYSTDRQWRVPHFEKMLEAHAGLIRNYVTAAQVIDPRYADVARNALDYLRTTLSDRQRGGYYGSQDADEEYYARDAEGRREMNVPFVDTRIYTNWNADMVDTALYAAAALGDDELADHALRTLDLLLTELRASDGAMRHNLNFDRQPQGEGMLTDQASMGHALLAAYAYTGDRAYLEAATKLADWLHANLYDAVQGGFYDHLAREGELLGRLRYPIKPLSENAHAADFLLRLYHLSGDERYNELAQAALQAFVGEYRNYGYFASGYALAVDHATSEPAHVIIVGKRTVADTLELARAAIATYQPWKLVQILSPSDEADSQLIQERGYPAAAHATAYVCVGQTCSAPVSDATALRRLLGKNEV